MRNLARNVLLAVSFLLLGLVLTGAVVGDSGKTGSYKLLSNFADTLELIETAYVEPRDLDEIMDGAFAGLVESLDPESAFLTSAELRGLRSAKRPEATTGLVISRRYGYGMVISVYPGSPADAAGLTSGDVIRAVNGRSTRRMNVVALRQALAGPADSKVKLRVQSNDNNEPRELTLERKAPGPLVVEARVLDEGAAYVRLTSLAQGAVAELRKALKELLAAESVTGVIVDLRSVSEGSVAEGLTLADLFVTEGVLIRVNGRSHETSVRKALGGLKTSKRDAAETDQESYAIDVLASDAALAFAGPVLVLVDQGTAGPAELAASALVSARAAESIGTRTFGNASIQELLDAGDGAALRLTVATFTIPDGDSLFGTGLKPSIEVEVEAEAEADAKAPKADDDPILDKALEILDEHGRKKKAA